MMTISQIQAHKIAAAIAAVREDWDPAGVLAALAKCTQREPVESLIAFARAAANNAIRTPAVAAMEGPHWHSDQHVSSASKHPSSVPIGDLCMTHGIHRDACGCHGRVEPPPWRIEHERLTRIERNVLGASAARAALDAAKANRAAGAYEPAADVDESGFE